MNELYNIEKQTTVKITHDNFIVKYDGKELDIQSGMEGFSYNEILTPDVVETLGMAIIDASKEFINYD